MDIVKRMQDEQRMSIGMVHTLPLPGSFRHTEDIDIIVDRAVEDAIRLERAGFDAIIVENVNDGPHEDRPMSFQKVAALTKICTKVRDAVKIPIGIDACGDPIAGFHIGSMTGITFIRIPYFVDIRISLRGMIMPNGASAVMERKRLGCEQIKIFADIQVKHTYPLVDSISLAESARWAVSSGADALIVTGTETGAETSLDDLKAVRDAVSIPIVAGSGVTQENVREQYVACNGAIIGSALKRDKSLMNPIEETLAGSFIDALGK